MSQEQVRSEQEFDNRPERGGGGGVGDLAIYSCTLFESHAFRGLVATKFGGGPLARRLRQRDKNPRALRRIILDSGGRTTA